MGALMSNITPVLVTMQTLDAMWPQCESFLNAGLQLSFGEMSVSQLRLIVTQGNANLIYLHNDEQTIVAHIISIGGNGLLSAGNSNEVLTLVKKWLKDQGATKVQGYCQPSRERLWRKLGCTESYRVVRMDL
jgi:hypothetical protein